MLTSHMPTCEVVHVARLERRPSQGGSLTSVSPTSNADLQAVFADVTGATEERQSRLMKLEPLEARGSEGCLLVASSVEHDEVKLGGGGL